MIKKKPKQSRDEINEQSKLLKRKRKHKGLPSGSRFKDSNKNSTKQQNTSQDPRIGSKKAVPLIVDSSKKTTPKANKEQVKLVKNKNLSPEAELTLLENDPYLEKLLDLIDDGESLTTKQQQDLDKMLDRIDKLMNELGYSNDDEDNSDDDDFAAKEDIISLLKNH